MKNRQTPTAKHQGVLVELCGGVAIELSTLEGVRDTTRRPTVSVNLGPWGLTETTNQRVCVCVGGGDLGLLHICSRCGVWSTGAGTVSDSVACHWVPLPYPDCLVSSVGENVVSTAEI